MAEEETTPMSQVICIPGTGNSQVIDRPLIQVAASTPGPPTDFENHGRGREGEPGGFRLMPGPPERIGRS